LTDYDFVIDDFSFQLACVITIYVLMLQFLRFRLTAAFVEYLMWIIFLSLFPVLGWKCLKRVKQNNALVKHRLGHTASVKYSGYDVVLPFIGK
jgi:hypothetical protein